MKKLLWIFLVLCFMSPPTAQAESGPGKKILRGFSNIITAPVEIPKQARAYWIEGAQKTDHILVWIGSGVVWGMVQGVKRAGSGVWDIVSFPFEQPEGYESLLKPGCVFDQWPRNPVSGR